MGQGGYEMVRNMIGKSVEKIGREGEERRCKWGWQYYVQCGMMLDSGEVGVMIMDACGYDGEMWK